MDKNCVFQAEIKNKKSMGNIAPRVTDPSNEQALVKYDYIILFFKRKKTIKDYYFFHVNRMVFHFKKTRISLFNALYQDRLKIGEMVLKKRSSSGPSFE